MIGSSPLLQAEFILYVYYQYNQGYTEKELISSLAGIEEGKEPAKETLEAAMTNSLFGSTTTANSFSREEAVKALKTMKENAETALREGHSYLDDMVVRNYRYFEPYVLNAYHEFMNKAGSLASIHNYLDAELEVFRSASFCFPGTQKHSEGLFSGIYNGQPSSGEDEESVKRLEFLQWFVTQYVIPAVDTVPSEWYYSRFRKVLNQRVLPIFRDVRQQRRSVFEVRNRSKNSVTLADLLYMEDFNVKMADAISLEKGNVVECTLIRHAASNRINSIVKLLSPEESKKLVDDINARRGLMSAMHEKFVASYGGEALMAANPQEAVAKYNEFASAFSEENGMKDAALPKLVNAEAFNSYPGFKSALLCEVNNFYLSIYYPLLTEAMEGRMAMDAAAELADICLTNEIALPFSTLKRVVSVNGARLIALVSRLRPEVRDINSLMAMVSRERGHGWNYLPIPLLTGGRPLGSTGD